MGKKRNTFLFVFILSVSFTVYYHSIFYTAVHKPENEAIQTSLYSVTLQRTTQSSAHTSIRVLRKSISKVSTPASTILEEPGLKHVPRSTDRVPTISHSLSIVHPKQKLTIGNYDDNNSTYIIHKDNSSMGALLNTSIQRTNTLTNHEMSILQDSFTFPQPIALKSKESIINSKWFMHLRNILSNWPSRYILTLSSNSAYKEVLLNWLISAVVNAQVILDNVLVIAFDEEIYQLLAERGITSVHIPFEDILSVDVANRAPIFTKIMMARLAVIRLINYWGFDVVHFDSDAIVLRNPLSLFELHQDSNIVGSLGKFPPQLRVEWGATMCAGLVMFRNTRQTEAYWKKVSEVHLKSFSDQERLNYGLKSLHVQWKHFDQAHVDSLLSSVEGVCANGLKVTLLPQSKVCRSTCNFAHKSSYTVWHKNGAKDGNSKKNGASAGHLWFLAKYWEEICIDGNMKGTEWLKCISSIV